MARKRRHPLGLLPPPRTVVVTRPNVFVAYDQAVAAAVRDILKEPDWNVLVVGDLLLGYLFHDALIGRTCDMTARIDADEWLEHLKTKVSGRVVFL